MWLLRNHCPSRVLKMFYYALVDSKIRYGICLWGGTYLQTIKPILVAQKYIIRVMFFKRKYAASWPLFSSNSILPLRHLYVFKVLKIYFIICGNRMLSPQALVYSLRNNDRSFKVIPRFNTTHFRKYFLVTAPTFYNQLPANIRTETNFKKFIGQVKDWLFRIESVEFLFDVIV
jgi:hypothetical protein